MNRQRGLFTPIEIVAVIVAIAGLLGCLWAAYAYIDKRGYDRGQQTQLALDAQKQAKAQAEWDAERARLQEGALATQQATDAAQAVITAGLTKERDNAIKKRNTVIDDIRDGRLLLLDPGINNAGAACNDQAGETATARLPDNGDAGGGRLSREASEFLYTEAGRADDYAQLLLAARKVILLQIEACNRE